jgi:transcriptional regulator with XRE-family HTH domain
MQSQEYISAQKELVQWFALNVRLLKSTIGVKLGAIAHNIGKSRQGLSNYLNEETPIPPEVIVKFCQVYSLEYPDIPILVEHLESLEIDEEKETDYKLLDKKERLSKSGIKFYNQDAMDARIDFFSDVQEKYVTAHFQIPTFNDCDYAITISGEDMLPTYQQGDVALCRAVLDRTQINYGDAYLLITSELRVIKFIHPAEKEGHILLKSSNQNFPAWVLDLNKISHLYSIKGVLRRKRM